MNVSFDGLRKNTTYSMNKLYDVLKEIIESGNLDDDQLDELKSKWNESARYVSTFNCLYDNSVENDMTDLSELDIDTFNEEE